MSLSLLKILNANNYFSVNRIIAHKIGLNATIFLSEIIDKFCFFQSQGKLQDGWFYITIEEAEERTTLARDAQDGAIKKLKELGLIETKQRGMPAKRHFKVFEEKITEWVISSSKVEESRNQECGNSPTQGEENPQPAPIYKSLIEKPKSHESCAGVRATPPSDSSPKNMTHDETLKEMEKEKKRCPEMKDWGPLKDRVDFLKAVVFPDKSTISRRNIETWSRNYSLWRMKKCASRILRMVWSGKELTNPEGLFYTLLADPHMESTQVVEEAREQAMIWMELNDIYFRMGDDYISQDSTGKDVPLALGSSKVIEMMKGWVNVR